MVGRRVAPVAFAGASLALEVLWFLTVIVLIDLIREHDVVATAVSLIFVAGIAGCSIAGIWGVYRERHSDPSMLVQAATLWMAILSAIALPFVLAILGIFIDPS